MTAESLPPPPPPPPMPGGDQPTADAAPRPAGDGFWGRVLRPIGAVLLAFGLSIPLAALLLATPLSEDTVNAAFLFMGGALILLFGIVFFRALPEAERRAALAPHGRPLTAVAVGIGVGVVVMFLSAMVIAAGLALDPGLEQRLEEAAAEIGPTPLQIALSVTALVVLAPLGEELVFRAMLLRGLMVRLNFWPAAVISGLLFAAAHIDAYVLWPRAISLTATGIALAWLYRRRGFWAAVAAHATVNSVAAVAIIATG